MDTSIPKQVFSFTNLETRLWPINAASRTLMILVHQPHALGTTCGPLRRKRSQKISEQKDETKKMWPTKLTRVRNNHWSDSNSRAIFTMSSIDRGCPKPITGYHIDAEGHWVAQLSCGHNQHVRHDPPWDRRDWVLSLNGRDAMIGFELYCRKCVDGAAADARPSPIEPAP